MIPPPAPAAADAASLLPIIFILLIPCAIAGLALMNAGLGRSRSAAHSMMSSLCVLAVAVLAYFVCGFAWQGFAGAASQVVANGGEELELDRLRAVFFFRHLALDGSPASLAALFGLLSAGLCAMIPLGSGGATAGGWARAAFPPRFWLDGLILFSRTGYRAEDGSRNSARATVSGADLWIRQARARYKPWAASPRYRLRGS